MNRRQFIKKTFGACTGLAVLPVVGKATVLATQDPETFDGLAVTGEYSEEELGKEFIGISEYPYCEC
ncbi:hypothetical protein LCGC14_2197470 [marine sediment metagenome]|uniref:Uncharacterized protein n=1 Tax=marine sediment metagenome TaxID=412755 RepID=A0A0F9DHQ2_9ZZZZ